MMWSDVIIKFAFIDDNVRTSGNSPFFLFFSFLSFLEGDVGVVKYGNGNNVAVKNKEAQWIWWKPDDCFK